MPGGAQVLTGVPRTSAGRRDKPVRIESVATSADPGYPVQTVATLADPVYMSRLDQRADERLAAQQDAASIETVWQMPYRLDMDPDRVDVPATRRLVYLGRVYDIVSAVMIGRTDIELHTLAGTRLG